MLAPGAATAVAFCCCLCGKTELVAPWNPMLASRICARDHTDSEESETQA